MKIFNRRPTTLTLDRQALADVVGPVVEAAVKALVPGLGQLPAGTTTSDLAARAEALAGAGMNGMLPFGPGTPLGPVGIDPREPFTGQPAPRRSEYPVSVNLQLQRNRFVPFSVLRETADRVDLVRRCIEARKAHQTSLDWDIVLSRRAVKRIMADEGIDSPGKASQIARRRYEPEMARLREWWERPDRLNGLTFSAWLSMLLEDLFVIDAVTVWPARNLAGDVMAFDLLDGSTIKPLLDHRGATPRPPAPAYQQVLYGFPRGEWEAGGADDEFRSDQIVYRPRHRRTWSPYGFSEVEQALSAADLYLKRAGWIRSEFDDGVMPNLWIKTDINVGGQGGMGPDQLLQYESVLNQSLAGNTPERHWAHLLPKGMEPEDMDGFAEKYNPALDDYLVKLVCMCFGVMPTEVGFPPSSGIGGKGHQEGEANSAFRKDIRPTATWLAELLTGLSRDYLAMSPDLEFSFIGYDVEDQVEAETAADMRTKSARATINEERARMGRPLFDFPEADTPYIQTAAGVVFLPGALSGTAAMDAPGKPTPSVPDPNAVAEESTAATSDPPTAAPMAVAPMAVAAEAAKFVSYARKRSGDMASTWRPFSFDAIDAVAAGELNRAGATGDLTLVRRLVAALTDKE